MAIDCIGIDIGYGFTKTCRSADKRMFPTAVTVMTKESTFADLVPVIVNGQRFLVAEDAEREGNTFETRNNDFVASNPWLALLCHSLLINNFAKGEIILGLPPGLYSRKHSKKIIDAIKASDMRVGGEPYRISGSVRIIPQGAGIFFCHARDHRDDLRKNVAVIDIGHHTVDMVFFTEGKYVESATETHKIGLSRVLDGIANAFLREYDLSIGAEAALTLLQGKEIVHLGTRYNVDVREEIDAYVKLVRSVISRYLEKLPLQPDLGIIGGGGAVVKGLGGRHNLLVVNEPAMANAVGYWYYGANVK